MTRIHDGERGFKDHFLEGLTAAYPRYLRRVPDTSAVMAVDVLVPFVDAFPESGPSLVDAWQAALPAARSAVDATADLMPRKGRAVVHGARALGTPDAGARSLGIALEAAGRALRAETTEEAGR